MLIRHSIHVDTLYILLYFVGEYRSCWRKHNLYFFRAVLIPDTIFIVADVTGLTVGSAWLADWVIHTICSSRDTGSSIDFVWFTLNVVLEKKLIWDENCQEISCSNEICSYKKCKKSAKCASVYFALSRNWDLWR